MSALESRLVNARAFVSYAHEDRETVSKLVGDLRRQGIDIWIDESAMLAGESIRGAVEQSIVDHDIFIVALSAHSVASRWVREELDMIHNRIVTDGALLVPVLLAECEVPLSLSGMLMVELWRDYREGLAAIVASVQKAAWDRTDRMLTSKLKAVTDEPRAAGEKSRLFAEIGSMAMALGRFAEAVAAFDRSIETSRTNWDAHQLRAGSLIKLGRFDDAERALKTLLRRGTQKARTNYNLACLFSRRAEASSRKALRASYLDLCADHLSASLSGGIVSWLREYGGRTDPIGGILTDPDLLFARRAAASVEEQLTALEQKRGKQPTPRTYGGGGGGCLVPGAGVLCADGVIRRIEEIQCGDVLASSRGLDNRGAAYVWRTIRWWESAGVTLNGRLSITSRQLIRTAKGWRRADQLTVGDHVRTSDDQWEVLQTVKSWTGLREVRHVNLESCHVFYAERVMLHNVKYK